MKKNLFLTCLCFLFCAGSVFAEVGVTNTEIVIGSANDLSGPAAMVGISAKNGMQLKIAEINESGGIHGRKIRLVMEDHAYKPHQAISVVNKMIHRDKVFAFVAILGTPTGLAVKPLISKKKIPQLFPVTAASGFFKPYDRYSFGMWTPYYDQARIMIKYFVEKKGRKNIGIMYQDDSYGSIVMEGVVDQLKEYGMKLVAKESYKRGATTFSTQIAKLKKANCDFVALATIITSTVGAISEAHKLGWKVDFGGLSGTYNHFIPYLLKKSGISSDGFYAMGSFPYVYPDHKNPKAREFYKKYVAKFDKKPDIFTLNGYLAVDTFAAAARKVGPQLTREKLIDTLETFQNRSDGIFDGAPVSYSSTSHQGMEVGMLMMLQKGKWIQITEPMSYQ